MRFSIRYFLLTLLLLAIEVLIAAYVHDNFVRPYLGDTLVIILMYCFLKSFTRIKTMPAIIAVLVFAFLVEAAQYFKLIHHLGIDHFKLARIVIGTSFAWEDLLAYSAGAMLILLVEIVFRKTRS